MRWLPGMFVMALLLAACAGETQTTPTGSATASSEASGGAYLGPGTARFRTHYAECIKIYDYDPDNPPPLGEYQLAPHEKDWRNCVYNAIRQYLIPASKTPELYRNLISTDQILTEGIEKRLVTRAQRHAKIDLLIDEIETQESQNAAQQQREAKVEAEAERSQFTRGMVQGLRGLQP